MCHKLEILRRDHDHLQEDYSIKYFISSNNYLLCLFAIYFRVYSYVFVRLNLGLLTLKYKVKIKHSI